MRSTENYRTSRAKQRDLLKLLVLREERRRVCTLIRFVWQIIARARAANEKRELHSYPFYALTHEMRNEQNSLLRLPVRLVWAQLVAIDTQAHMEYSLSLQLSNRSAFNVTSITKWFMDTPGVCLRTVHKLNFRVADRTTT